MGDFACDPSLRRRGAAALVRLALALGAAVAAHAPADLAAQPAAGAEQAAKDLFEQGYAALERKDYDGACELFEQSLAALERAGTHLGLAQCEEGRHRIVEALAHWRKGLALLPKDDERLAPGAERMVALDQRIPQVTVRLPPGAPPATAVALDGDPVAIGVALSVNPGEHELLTTAPDHVDKRTSLTLEEGARREVVAERLERVAVPVEPVDPDLGDGQRMAGWVVEGLGLAAAAAFAITGGVIVANAGAIDRECPDKLCTAKGFDLVGRTRTLNVVNAVMLGVGLAGMGAGAVVIVTAPSAPSAEPAAAVKVMLGGAF
ncbi:MAG: hypothetical protein HY908_15590 [Myxococcales bacterium]|nr:hypothetical protein [Myxococcales bacterium]